MNNENKDAIWTAMFDEQVNEKGIVFPSEESKIASLNDFIRQAEDGVDEPEVNVIDSTLKVDQVATQSNHEEKATDAKKVISPKTEKKNYKPVYTDSKKVELQKVTDVFKEELARIIADDSIPTFTYGDGHNCVIDLTEFVRKGGEVVTPKVNREHGKDMGKTGDSTKMYGAQQLLLCITKKVADMAGIEVERFSNDKSTAPISENALVLENGSGRFNYLYGLEEADRPQYFATLIEPDAHGYYNPRKAMEVINTERLMWKTQDMMVKRQLEDGQTAHSGWNEIQELIKKGYLYQAACQAMTLSTDRITSKNVTGGDVKEIFVHFESAKKVHDALVQKFGEGDDKTLKTKEFPKEVSILWHKLLNYQGEKFATDTFIKFIESFKDTKVKDILNAKSVKNGMKKDDIRKNILNEQFKQFVGKENIDLD